MKKITYILPAYNEQDGIKEFHKVLTEETKELTGQYLIDYIYINDGSKDKTLEILTKLAEEDNSIKIINFSRNYGHQIAITAGLDFTDSDAAIIMDVDLQDPPKVSIEMIEKWEDGAEIVYAKRKGRKDSVFKKVTAHIFYRLLERLTDSNIPEDTGDFRLIDKKPLKTIKRFREKNRYMRGLFSIIGYKQDFVLFDREERLAGETHYPIRKMISLALDGITGFSLVPLRFITSIGFVVSILSLLGIFYAIGLRIFFPSITVSGFTFTVTSILFIGGVQMVMLGILGEYIGRIYEEVRGRPLYTISEIYGIQEVE